MAPRNQLLRRMFNYIVEYYGNKDISIYLNNIKKFLSISKSMRSIIFKHPHYNVITLFIACKWRNFDVAKKIIERKPICNKSLYRIMIDNVVMSKNIEFVNLIINYGIDIKYFTAEGSLLDDCHTKEDYDYFKTIINMMGGDRITPGSEFALARQVKKNNKDIVKFMISKYKYLVHTIIDTRKNQTLDLFVPLKDQTYIISLLDYYEDMKDMEMVNFIKQHGGISSRAWRKKIIYEEERRRIEKNLPRSHRF